LPDNMVLRSGAIGGTTERSAARVKLDEVPAVSGARAGNG
jgi:hypothetical protein